MRAYKVEILEMLWTHELNFEILEIFKIEKILPKCFLASKSSACHHEYSFSMQSVESVNSVESVESVNSVESVESVNSVESVHQLRISAKHSQRVIFSPYGST